MDNGAGKIYRSSCNTCDDNEKQDQREPLSFRQTIQLAQCKVGEQDDQQRCSQMKEPSKNNCEGEHAVGDSGGRAHNQPLIIRFTSPGAVFVNVAQSTGITDPGCGNDQ